MENKKKINKDFHQLYSIWKKHRDELAITPKSPSPSAISPYNEFAKRINYEVVPFIQILKNAKILDYGCGCGHVGLLCLLLEGTQVDFFDPLEKNLKYLRYLVNEYNFNNYKIFSTDLFPEIKIETYWDSGVTWSRAHAGYDSEEDEKYALNLHRSILFKAKQLYSKDRHKKGLEKLLTDKVHKIRRDFEKDILNSFNKVFTYHMLTKQFSTYSDSNDFSK